MAKKAAGGGKSRKDATSGIKERLRKPATPPPYQPTPTERAVGKYVYRRSNEMIDYRKSLNVQSKWQQADEEYIPHELDFGATRKRFETDQDTGLRSRMVPVGDTTQQWRQQSSAPTLLAKIQTAVSIIIDNEPEADLVALEKKYSATTDLAYALWKRNWSITAAKEKLKLTIFNLIKYGWASQRTYPRLVEYDKRIKDEVDPENPENDKYIEKKITWFNDVDREPLDPYRCWIDELTKPYDPLSCNENYFEVDYSYDQFKVEFGKYPNSEFVPEDSAYLRIEQQAINTFRQTVTRMQQMPDQTKIRKDIVTVGFFESRTKDLYAIYIPRHGIVLYSSPLPNDDGYLSVSHTLWLLRTSKLPYGISLWEIIRQNKALYDKMKNMTMDQLVLSIMKFGFFSGTSTSLGDGKIDIIPGQARQLTTSSGSAKDAINWMEIPGPGEEAWKGLEAVADMMDDDSGISPTLEGDITGKTLGEILHAKEASLKRLKVPVENIAWLIDQDAYLTLSWMSQLYAIPTIKQFADEAELMAYEREEQTQHSELFGQQQDDGTITGPYQAHFLPQLGLHLEDSEGKLVEGKESKFYQVGSKMGPDGKLAPGYILPSQLKWKGVFKTIPRSIVDSSETLVKAAKTDIFNLLVPLLQFPPELAAKPAQQILKINEEDPEDWLPDSWLAFLEQGTPSGMMPAPGGAPGGQPGAGGGQGGTGGQPAAGGAPAGNSGAPPTLQAGAGAMPATAQTVVPRGQISPQGGIGGGTGKATSMFNKRL